jgi:hypothetical protein
MGRPGARWCQELIDRRGQRLEANTNATEELAMRKNQRQPGSGHLWAIGYDDMERADQVRDKITTLGWGGLTSISRTWRSS